MDKCFETFPSLREHVGAFTNRCMRLREADLQLDERLKKALLMASLGEQHDALQQVFNSDPDITYEKMVSLLLQEEQRIQLKDESSAFAVKFRGRAGGKRGKAASGGNPKDKQSGSGNKKGYTKRKGTCHTCGEEGHWARDCKSNKEEQKEGNTHSYCVQIELSEEAIVYEKSLKHAERHKATERQHRHQELDIRALSAGVEMKDQETKVFRGSASLDEKVEIVDQETKAYQGRVNLDELGVVLVRAYADSGAGKHLVFDRSLLSGYKSGSLG